MTDNNLKNHSKPWLSVVIPIYNAEKYLKECLESIRKQSFKDFEVLLIDDGSVDLSSEICKGYEVSLIHKHMVAGFHFIMHRCYDQEGMGMQYILYDCPVILCTPELLQQLLDGFHI